MAVDVDDTWELAGSVRVARSGGGWDIVGGWEEDDAVGVYVIVHHPMDDELIKRYRLRVAIEVVDDELVLGAATVIRGQ